MAKENIRVLKIDTDAAQTSVKDLRQELKQLKDTLLSTEKGTEEYNKTLQQAADIQHTLKEQMEEINASAMDFGQITGNIVKATGGMVAGFQAAKATMNLFGIENENVIKSLEKMQNLMAITQAIPALDDGVKAFKRLSLAVSTATGATSKFGKALVSTGLGAIAVALGYIVTHFEEISKWLDEITGQTDFLGKVTDSIFGVLNAAIPTVIQSLKAVGNAIVTYVTAPFKSVWDGIQAFTSTNGSALDKLKAAGSAMKNGFVAEWKEVGNDFKEVGAIAAAKFVEGYEKSHRERWEKAKVQLSDDIISLNEALLKKIEEWMYSDKKANAIKIPIVFEVEDEDVSAADALKNKIINTINSLRGAFVTPEEQYQQEINALELALKTKLIKEEEYLKLRDALNAEQTQKEVLRYTTAANSIADIFNNLGGLMEEGSEEQKAFQIMGATINMISGIVAALSGTFTTHTGIWDIVLAATQAAAIATAGATNIAKIAQTNKNNAKSMATGAKSSASALSSVIAPVQYTQDVQGASIEGAIKDSKVYVVESDITNTQNKVSVTEEEARF